MGVSTSAVASSKEWEPATQANMPRKMSKAGYDITPLTQELKDAEAAKASPNTRCMHSHFCSIFSAQHPQEQPHAALHWDAADSSNPEATLSRLGRPVGHGNACQHEAMREGAALECCSG